MKIIKYVKSLDKSTKILATALLIVLLLSAGTMAFNTSQDEDFVPLPEITQQPKTEKEQPPETVEKTPAPTPAPTPEPETAQWPVIYSMDQASSLTVVVNKKHKLPSNYAPNLQSVPGGQLRPEAANAISALLADAQNAGVPMKIISSYRSYDTQVSTYNKWVQIDGKAQADRSSARAGHSEHQTGLAVDVGMPDGSCNLEICFGSKPQGIWVAQNAHKYGFIVRYESDTEAVTGYQYEPWHLRYLGVDIATAVVNSGQTLDQYYGVEAGGYN
jgi:D-alanyl-D-alanine carboxypeptidase